MNKEIIKLQKKIDIAEARIEEIRAACNHETAYCKYGADTGNWCSNDDCYWVDAICLECGEWNRYDSKKDAEKYHYYGKQVKR